MTSIAIQGMGSAGVESLAHMSSTATSRSTTCGKVMRDRYWVPDDKHVWLPCILYSRADSDDQVTFLAEDGRWVTVPSDKFQSLPRVEPSQLEGVDDICALPDIEEGAMLHTVRERYFRREIYTRVARVLVAVNPFCSLPIYSSEHLDAYAACRDSTELPPHIFGITQDALRGLRGGDHRNHVMLISGESGAGKTESSKLMLSFIAEASRAGDGSIEEKIVTCSPIFESFGNAMTVRNNNSSRFGKWLDIRFSGCGELRVKDCSVENYLLETTRVCTHGKGERSYHIFYQLLERREEYPELRLEGPENYRYLSGGAKKAVGLDDARNFEETLEALGPLGFSEDQQKQVFQVVAAVLMMGNIEFATDDRALGCTLADPKMLEKAAAALGVSADMLRKCLMTKKLNVDGQDIETLLNKESAQSVRDTIARVMYGGLFDWLVQRMNEALCPASVQPSAEDSRSLGVLDIAGFESFETNSLEQLLINLSNEHLQQSFNSTIVKSELKDYEAEGIDLHGKINFNDNADVLEVLDGKQGLLDMLDEESALPRGSDTAYASKVVKVYGSHRRLVPPKFGGNPKFGVQHFAGVVTYTCTGFLEKNTQKVPEMAGMLLTESSIELLRGLGKPIAEEAAQNASKIKGARMLKKPKSASLGFRKSLRSLMEKIEGAERHYVRCVKPNAEKLPDRFNSPMVIEQLLFCGVMEAVRIRSMGYSTRLPFDDFIYRYRCIMELLGKAGLKQNLTAKQLVGALPTVLGNAFSAEDVVVGKSKVFAKKECIKLLEKGRAKALWGFATRLQAVARRVLARRRFIQLFEMDGQLHKRLEVFGAFDAAAKAARIPAGGITERCFDSNTEKATEEYEKLLEKLTEAVNLGLQNHTAAVAEAVLRTVGHELDALASLKEMAKSLDPISIGKTLARAKGLGLCEPRALVKRMKDLQVQLPLIQTMEHLPAALDQESDESGDGLDDNDVLAEIVRAVKAAGLSEQSVNWIPELKGKEMFAAVAGRHRAVEERRRQLAEQRQREREEEERRIAEELRMAEEEAKQKQREEEAAESARKAAEKAEEERKRQEALEAEMAKAREQSGAKLRKHSMASMSRRSSAATVTGFSEEDQQELLETMRTAVDEFDAARLEDALRKAVKNGMNRNDVMPFQLVFDQLQQESFVVDAISSAEEEAKRPDPTDRCLQRLRNLSDQLKRLRGDEEKSRGARQSVAVAARRKSMNVSFAADKAAAIIPKKTFAKLEDFPMLKAARTWKGHRGTMLEGKDSQATGTGPMTRAIMLSHSKLLLAEAVTHVPMILEKEAVQIFRDVLVWMQDRAAQDYRRQAARDAVLRTARVRDELRDEVYVQVMKQLNRNPSEKSLMLGWQLLHLLCLSVPPSDQLAEYVQGFLRSRAAMPGADSDGEDDDPEIPADASGKSEQAHARRCLGALKSLDGLPRMRSYMWKKSTAKLRFKGYDWRYVSIRNMHIYWWKTLNDASTPEAAGASGGPSCQGFINLMANDCKVEPDPKHPTIFTISSTAGTWMKEAVLKDKDFGTNRAFTFDAIGSDHSREEWMEVLNTHIQRTKLVRAVLESSSRVPSLHYLANDAGAATTVQWRFADATFSNLRWSRRASLEDAMEKMRTYMERKEAQRPIDLEFSSWSNTSVCASEEVTVPNIYEAIAILKELVAVQKEAAISAPKAAEAAKRRSTALAAAALEPVADTAAKVEEASPKAENGAAKAEPSQKLKEGDTVYYVRHTNVLPDDSELQYGAQGKIMRVDSQQGAARVGVRFPGIKFTIGCSADDISLEPPPADFGGGWRMGQTAYYVGRSAELDDGHEVSSGSQGVVIGPGNLGPGDTSPSVAVRFPGVRQGVNCKVADVSREPPPTVLTCGWQVGDQVVYTGHHNVFDGGLELKTGAEGQVVGADTEAPDRIVIKYPALSLHVSCAAVDLAKPGSPEAKVAVKPLPGGWQVGDMAWYVGENNAFADDDGGPVLKKGTRGEVVGAGDNDDLVTVRFEGIAQMVICRLADLSREPWAS
eukprot:TRINITY_DN3003_c0_g1_i1.p1 TRINITY_DN3003_c0_g1~~TRINITY_DN3003_c0_g1_i1.p1  ORF type:complete len:2014 (+),score=568.16 TRINITY_DN3003_c0_g1_i1:150-6191(+)